MSIKKEVKISYYGLSFLVSVMCIPSSEVRTSLLACQDLTIQGHRPVEGASAIRANVNPTRHISTAGEFALF